jgi:hypothetical protein
MFGRTSGNQQTGFTRTRADSAGSRFSFDEDDDSIVADAHQSNQGQASGGNSIFARFGQAASSSGSNFMGAVEEKRRELMGKQTGFTRTRADSAGSRFSFDEDDEAVVADAQPNQRQASGGGSFFSRFTGNQGYARDQTILRSRSASGAEIYQMDGRRSDGSQAVDCAEEPDYGKGTSRLDGDVIWLTNKATGKRYAVDESGELIDEVEHTLDDDYEPEEAFAMAPITSGSAQAMTTKTSGPATSIGSRVDAFTDDLMTREGKAATLSQAVIGNVAPRRRRLSNVGKSLLSGIPTEQ